MACSACQEPPTPKARSELAVRWLVLGLLCLSLFGSYYVYDNPAAVENQLSEYFFPGGNSTSADDDSYSSGGSSDADSFSFRFNLLYSVYSFPNVILPFFGGYISDILGVRLMMVAFLLLITVGQAIFAFGATLQGDAAWYVMYVGRTVFGFGGESLSVAQSALIAGWFQGKELAFALGLNLALARVGSVVNDAVSLQIANKFPVYAAFWAGLVVCAASLICGVWCYYVDERADDRIRREKGLRPMQRPGLIPSLLCVSFWRKLLTGKNTAEQEDSHSLLVNADGSSAAVVYEDEPPSEVIEMKAVLKFPLTFWLLTLSCVTVYVCVLSFNNISSGLVKSKWSLSNEEASTVMLTTYLVAGFLAPFMGGIIDKVGGRAFANAGAAAAIVGVHAMLGYTKIYPVVPLVLLGVCYSVYASALWPSIALVTEPRYHATAYGVVTAVQNLGLAVIPLAVGALMPPPHCKYDDCVADYAKVESLFIGLGSVGFVAGVALNVADFCAPVPVLNWSSKRVDQWKAQQEGGLGLGDADVSTGREKLLA